MLAAQIYRELSKGYGWWAGQCRKVRWLASRYYSGAENLGTLRSHAEPQPFGEGTLQPLLTHQQVKMIIDLR